MPRDKTDDNLLKIWCNNCDNLQRCHIIYKNKRSIRGEDWFTWEILKLSVGLGWSSVDKRVCNRHPDDMGVHFTTSQKVGLSTVAAQTHGISTEISFTLQNDPLTFSGDFKFLYHKEWTTEETKMQEHTTTVTIRGAIGTNGVRVPPNKRAVLKQIGIINNFLFYRYPTTRVIQCTLGFATMD